MTTILMRPHTIALAHVQRIAKAMIRSFTRQATDASKLNDIFTEIQEEILTSAQSPTHVDQGEDPSHRYITITDQLGDYMQVDDLNTLPYAEQMLTSGTQATADRDKKQAKKSLPP